MHIKSQTHIKCSENNPFKMWTFTNRFSKITLSKQDLSAFSQNIKICYIGWIQMQTTSIYFVQWVCILAPRICFRNKIDSNVFSLARYTLSNFACKYEICIFPFIDIFTNTCNFPFVNRMHEIQIPAGESRGELRFSFDGISSLLLSLIYLYFTSTFIQRDVKGKSVKAF